jgi:tetratricopeptide (TPR) repeat protein
MIELIVWANKWKYPVYFATSVPNSNRWTLGDYTVRKGMALQVVPEKTSQNIDGPTTEKFLYNTYHYRGISDLNIYKDENNVGLTTTYPERFMELAKYYSDRGDSTKAKITYWDCIAKFPYYYQSYIDLKGFYGGPARADSARVVYDTGVRNLNAAVKAWPEIVLYRQFLGIVHYANQNNPEAIKCYRKSLDLDPSNNISFRFLLQLYTMSGERDKGEALLNWWISQHPDDREALQMKGMYRRMPAQG